MNYAAQPTELNLYRTGAVRDGNIVFSARQKNIAEVQGYAKAALNAQAVRHVARDKNAGICFSGGILYP